jgi:hypothetical protein
MDLDTFVRLQITMKPNVLLNEQRMEQKKVEWLKYIPLLPINLIKSEVIVQTVLYLKKQVLIRFFLNPELRVIL